MLRGNLRHTSSVQSLPKRPPCSQQTPAPSSLITTTKFLCNLHARCHQQTSTSASHRRHFSHLTCLEHRRQNRHHEHTRVFTRAGSTARASRTGHGNRVADYLVDRQRTGVNGSGRQGWLGSVSGSRATWEAERLECPNVLAVVIRLGERRVRQSSRRHGTGSTSGKLASGAATRHRSAVFQGVC